MADLTVRAETINWLNSSATMRRSAELALHSGRDNDEILIELRVSSNNINLYIGTVSLFQKSAFNTRARELLCEDLAIVRKYATELDPSFE